ncbi:LANO_0H22232g1_1 [Lachancea nothofagi CBS 11611]|uniref:LANO_0H22232g1_1 n=1 Tax=Lachancea nothofagi CBS 11611 TaxID=1266666 RepID=A0A1G4KNL5_9SACH|nr:LANO_0H22232g1_1 [Lachancea nothofagi CBS 11611]
MVAIVRYIPKSSLWLCPVFLIGSDFVTSLYGNEKGQASVKGHASYKTRKLASSRRKNERRHDGGKNKEILHRISEFN